MSMGTNQYAKLEAGQDAKATTQMGDMYHQEQRRRNYEICMVFKCKTSKAVKYDDGDAVSDLQQRSALFEPSDEARNTMMMWKQRREAILKSLQNCGLRLFCYYSRDRDEILVKIGASPQKLRDTAARMKYKLQLKKQYLNAYAEYRHDFPGRPERHFKDRRVISHIYKTHTEDDFPDSDAIFKTLDKINLIHHMITSKDKDCAGINIGNLLHQGDLKAYFPLHESHVLSEMKMHKLQWFLMPEDFANKFRDYFGDRIAFYFLWMAFYWKWLVPLALVGVALQFIDLLIRSPDNITAIPFCILMGVWATFLPYFWRRQEAKYAIGWGTLDLVEALEKCRPEYYGDPRINPVTAQVEPYFDWKRRLKYYALSCTTMCITTTVLVCVCLSIVLLRHHMGTHGPGGLWGFQISVAIFVELVNVFLAKMASWLTAKENHRTQSEHETHMLSKVMVLKFICSYCILYYTAFFKHHSYLFNQQMECWRDDCFLDLQWQLGIFVMFRLVVSNTVEYFTPKVKLWWRSLYLDRNQGVGNRSQSVNNILHSTLSGHTSLELADMSAAEQQAKKDKYDEFATSDDALISHGFTTFFAVASPWVCIAALVSVLVEIAVDMKSLMDNRQRPIPIRARNNEPWSTAFDIYGVLAASTNIFLLIFASKQYETWTFTEKLVLFIYLEHMILFARLLLRVIFPQVPRNVELLQLKQDNMVHRCLENIKVEQNQDFSMFRDHRDHNIHVFDQDILDREDANNDDKELDFDLNTSTDAFIQGLKDETVKMVRQKS